MTIPWGKVEVTLYPEGKKVLIDAGRGQGSVAWESEEEREKRLARKRKVNRA